MVSLFEVVMRLPSCSQMFPAPSARTCSKGDVSSGGGGGGKGGGGERGAFSTPQRPRRRPSGGGMS